MSLEDATTKPTIETLLERMDDLKESMNARFNAVEERFNARFDEMEENFGISLDRIESLASKTRSEMLEWRADFREILKGLKG